MAKDRLKFEKDTDSLLERLQEVEEMLNKGHSTEETNQLLLDNTAHKERIVELTSECDRQRHEFGDHMASLNRKLTRARKAQ